MFRKNCVWRCAPRFVMSVVMLVSVGSRGDAEPQSLFADRAPLIGVIPQSLVPVSLGQESAFGPSLFVGRVSGSLFDPAPPRLPSTPTISVPNDESGYLAVIRNVIGRAESRRDGYDAIQHAAKVLPRKRPTQMTLGEIFAWIDATPGQPHAIGRYQFIPKTLARLVTELDLGPEVVFTPAVQDRLSDMLLREAGLYEARQGQIPRREFMNNLAKIWAGLPTSTGKSHYHGYAGNKATMSWAEFDREMARIFAG